MSHLFYRPRPLVDNSWEPGQLTGSATTYTNVATNPTHDVITYGPGYLSVGLSFFFVSNAFANLAFRFVPMTSGGSIDTTITYYDQFAVEGQTDDDAPLGFSSLFAAWYIPTARTMKIGAQYHRNAPAGDVSFNVAVGGVATTPTQAVIAFTPL